MRKILAAAVALPTLGFILSCSGLGSSYDNVTPCKKYVEHYNNLKCIPKEANIKPDDMCPAGLDMTPKDLSPFYECMTKNAKCKGKVFDAGGQTSCKM